MNGAIRVDQRFITMTSRQLAAGKVAADFFTVGFQRNDLLAPHLRGPEDREFRTGDLALLHEGRPQAINEKTRIERISIHLR